MRYSEDKFRDAASSVAASYSTDVTAINPADDYEIQVSKARSFLLEAADMILEADSIESVSKILMEVIGAIDGPVVYVSDAAASLRGALALIVESSDRKLAAECMAAAVGVIFTSGQDTMADIAQSHGITRAAVSKRVREIQTSFGISSASMNKRSLSRDGYRDTNVRRRAKSDF